MPTKHHRHAITETPRVKRALDPLRQRLDASAGERLDLGELVILGAEAKLAALDEELAKTSAARLWLADRIRSGQPLADPEAAEKVKRRGWSR